MSKRKKVLITGASGLVGSAISEKLSLTFEVLTPSRKLLDITSKASVVSYMSRHKPDIVIHAAAFTDATAAEEERGDKKGEAWKTNVVGTQNIDMAAKRVSAFHIFISTGSVFSGNKNNPGPFAEDDKSQDDPSKLSWYGWTKRMAEKNVYGAIIRISHPYYIQRLVGFWQHDRDLGFFTDQLFPLTSLEDLARVIDKLIRKRTVGIYHVASPDFVSPYELWSYYCLRHSLSRNTIKTRTSPKNTQYHAIRSIYTQKKLGLHFKTWKETVDLVFPD